MLATIERPRLNGDVEILAARPMNLRNKRDSAQLDNILMLDRINSTQSWRHFKRIGEVHFALTRAAKIAGYTKIFPVRYNPAGSVVETEIESGREVDIVQGIYSNVGGLRGLIERYFIQQKVPAESHLIRIMDGENPDGYQFLSSRELSTPRDGSRSGLDIANAAKTGGLTWTSQPQITNGVNAFENAVAAKNYLGRLWTPSPDYMDVPESPLSALDTQCQLLDDMTQVMAATLKSRFALGGMIFFPNSIRDVLANQKTKTGKNKTALDVIYEIMKANVEVSDQSSTVTPLLLMGDDEAGEKIKVITLDREILEADLRLRAELIDRILFGLDIIPSATTSGEDVNHFGAWQASADELRLAVIPDIEALMWAFNRLILHPALLEAKVEPDVVRRTGIWYDLSSAAVRANRQADAKNMREQGLLSDLATLQAGGWSEKDLLVGVEYIRWFGRWVKDPYLGTFDMPEAEDIDWSKVSTKSGGRNPDGTPALPAGPGVGDPGSPDDEDTDRPEDSKPV